MDDQDVILLRQGDDLFKEVQLHTLRRWIRGKTKDHHLRLRVTLADGAFQLVKEIHTFHQRHRAHLRPGNHRAIDMNRIAGVRHQYGVAMIQRRQHQVRQPLFRTNGDDRFRFRIDIDVIAFFIPA